MALKTAVVSLAIGKFHTELSKLTFPRFKAYAERIGSTFLPITEQKVSQTTAHWEKFQIYDILATYDRIIYLDADIVIRNDADNLFDVVPESQIGMFNEASYTDNKPLAMQRIAEAYNAVDFKWDGAYYNSGVIVASKSHRILFLKPKYEHADYYEQSYLNLVIQRQKLAMHNLHYKYNRMYCMDQLTGEPRHASQIIHYAGIPSQEAIFTIAKKDIEICDSSTKDTKYPRKIWISVEGGLGDQMQAEPTIRFLRNNLYADDDVRVTTHFPELFQHLPVVVAKHEKHVWEGVDTTPWKRITLPSPDREGQVLWTFVSNMLCHTVDFASIAVLRRTLPDKDKEYQLMVKRSAIESVKEIACRKHLNDCVLVHAGQHWSNKSFPKEYWESVVREIQSTGLTPILIGKNEETRGVVTIPTMEGVIDLVNLLSLDELIAIISLCPYLISNDSAPIHLAGAFDNWIFLIPTCKHPDHLLPWRKGSKYYKAKALYKKLMAEEIPSHPTEVYTVLGDKLTGEWNEYLPEAKTIVEEIQNIRGTYAK